MSPNSCHFSLMDRNAHLAQQRSRDQSIFTVAVNIEPQLIRMMLTKRKEREKERECAKCVSACVRALAEISEAKSIASKVCVSIKFS